MPIKYPENAIYLAVSTVHFELGDAGVLHGFAPALHLAAGVSDAPKGFRLGLDLRVWLA
jgi:hypothetical protein